MTTTEQLYAVFKKYPLISTDSRQIEKDSLFFALKGENFNGNTFAKTALEKGAAFAIIDEPEYVLPEQTILVSDVLQALKDLATHHRKKLGIPILGITGTNGKTTTKELIAAVLSEKFNVGYTQGNLNNHIGVPLTLLKMNTQTEFGVVEMGANHPGEIDHLCSIADPDFGIITNVGKAHLEGFGSFEGVIRTKTELYRYLQNKDGLVFYNADNPILSEQIQPNKRKLSYGTKSAGFTGELLNSPPFVNVKANFKKGVLYLNTKLIGEYNFENILAAACIGNYFEVDPLKIQSALKSYTPRNNRSQLIVKGNISIFLDAYNANPTSMSASIKSFMQTPAEINYLILGDMLELGDYSEFEHTNILTQLEEYSEIIVYLVGENFEKSAGNKKHNWHTFGNVQQLCDYILANPVKNGRVLIKGSRGIQLEKVMDVFS